MDQYDMIAIYDLKQQLHKLIITETKKIFPFSRFDKVNNPEDNIDLYLYIKAINLESIDTKNYYYKINFNLFFNFSTAFFYNNEQKVYSVLENILKLLHSMEFYYCYKVNNNNIKSIIPFNKQNVLEVPFVTVEWITNVNHNSSWFN